MLKHLSVEDYTIVWLAPLDIERDAALSMLDEIHETPRQDPSQTVQYQYGSIGSLNIAIPCFPGVMGLPVASMMAALAKRDLPNLKYGFLVGIAAGIPSTTADIRLGDVAVARPSSDNSGIVGHDRCKVEDEKVQLKQWQNSTDFAIGSAISKIQSQKRWISHLSRFENSEFKFPHAAAASTARSQRREPSETPQVHYGSILSGNLLVKSAGARDRLKGNQDAIALEMEAAGVMNILPVGVIRGISDFADANKNDDWRLYAAATASCYAKEVIICLGSGGVKHEIEKAVPTFTAQTPLDQMLEEKSRGTQFKDYRNSIVDLLRLLSLDSSPDGRDRLANHLNIRIGKSGSFERNRALHQCIMRDLARNNGVVSDQLRAVSKNG